MGQEVGLDRAEHGRAVGPVQYPSLDQVGLARLGGSDDADRAASSLTARLSALMLADSSGPPGAGTRRGSSVATNFPPTVPRINRPATGPLTTKGAMSRTSGQPSVGVDTQTHPIVRPGAVPARASS